MIRITLFAVFCLAAASTAGAAPIQWAGNGHYYDVIDVPGGINWTNADAAASAMTFLATQGHLATVTSAGEDDFIINNFDEFHKWLGGFQPPDSPGEPTDGWQWVTGEPWGYTNWAAGEPNSFSEDWLHYGVMNTGVWNDFSNFPLAGFVVEFDVVPEPSSAILAGVGAAISGLIAVRRYSRVRTIARIPARIAAGS
jgi:hypothetical protein